MTAQTAITIAVIALAAFMGVATIYGVWLSFSPRYAPETEQSLVGYDVVKHARQIAYQQWHHKEVL